jgi:hypothetical protein
VQYVGGFYVIQVGSTVTSLSGRIVLRNKERPRSPIAIPICPAVTRRSLVIVRSEVSLPQLPHRRVILNRADNGVSRLAAYIQVTRSVPGRSIAA